MPDVRAGGAVTGAYTSQFIAPPRTVRCDVVGCDCVVNLRDPDPLPGDWRVITLTVGPPLYLCPTHQGITGSQPRAPQRHGVGPSRTLRLTDAGRAAVAAYRRAQGRETIDVRLRRAPDGRWELAT